jgi:polyisoprenoid-binding protein YceI
MTKKIIVSGMILLFLVAAVFAYSYLKPPAAASSPIQTVPIEGAAIVTEATSRAGAESTREAEVAERVIFEIEQSSSEVRYIIDEVLGGMPNTVVGATDQIAGQIAVDLSGPEGIEVGTIMINARTFRTDDETRDRAVQNRILQTDRHEFITFVPTEVKGLPESVEAGQPYTFQIVGDLNILDVRREVTWDVTVMAVTESHLEGLATTSIRYADWGVRIPDVPFVADASEEVRLELEFTAVSS